MHTQQRFDTMSNQAPTAMDSGFGAVVLYVFKLSQIHRKSYYRSTAG